ncbi:hypothetical protein MSAN_01255600 [Mycena sanguinolenta]|uniref:F-box domain-containing protein n=1 Tax=Mycena sanguinolenta TaxID=230812 RepID=A0A8H7D2J5_9AGAR|nr:hypothetical protein MSAN_01255600 [Mycena sanguinolenta]
MSSIGLLVPDLLRGIMFALPLNIDQKFAFAQVSRLWRELALGSHTFWSSFIGGDSKADFYRVPLVLERTGQSIVLHVQFRFIHANNWPADILATLVPYVTRLITLDIEFTAPMHAKALLGAALVFPVLQTLRIKSSIYRNVPGLLLTAPVLRTLDIERVHLTNWDTLLCTSLENIRLCDSPVEMLLEILKRCPRAQRIVLQTWYPWSGSSIEDSFAAFTSRPLAPALRELELEVRGSNISRILQAGFSDVVLHTLTGRIYNGHRDDDLEVLSHALLSGVGPLVSFNLVDMQELVLHDAAGRIRRLRCCNGDSCFEVGDVWKYLSIHYNLHETAREIRIRLEFWDELVGVFELHPPQLADGITLAIQANGNTDFRLPNQIMRLPGLFKVEFRYPMDVDTSSRALSDVLALIELPAARKVELCLGKRKYPTELLGWLREKHWTICSHCAQ